MARLRLVQLLSLTVGGLCALLATPALAQNPAAAEALFEQARSAMAAGSYDIACARFRDSDKLDPAVGTRFNLADCEERLGQNAKACEHYVQAMQDLSTQGRNDRLRLAQERARRLGCL